MNSEATPSQLAQTAEVQMKIRCAIQDVLRAGFAAGAVQAALQRECKYWGDLNGEG